MLITHKEALSKVTVWYADSNLSENEKNLTEIRQWWERLDGKVITWEVFSEAINSTTPLIKERLVIETPLIKNQIFYWRKQGLKNWNSLPVQYVVLDNSMQRLDIISSLENWFGSKYRVQILEAPINPNG
jgi:hypothetical protein